MSKKKITCVFDKLGGGRPLMIPPGFDNQGSYAGFTFRHLVPEYGNIPIHCGNLFHDRFYEFYTHLTSICEVIDQLSYFFMLQSSGGGELVLYDLEWQTGQHIKTNTIVEDADNNIIDASSGKGLKRMTLPIETGDLLVFAGGEIWHSVNQITGSASRITLGGFIGFENNHEGFYYWS